MKQPLSIALFACLLFVAIPVVWGQPTNSGAENGWQEKKRKSLLPQNIIKLDLMSAIHGDMAFSYEHNFPKIVSIEGGLGIVMFRYVPEFIDWVWLNDVRLPYSNYKGLSFKVQARAYLLARSVDSPYVGLGYRQRNYWRKETKGVPLHDLFFSFGYRTVTSSRLSLDFSTGLGLRRTTYSRNFFVSIGLQLGVQI